MNRKGIALVSEPQHIGPHLGSSRHTSIVAGNGVFVAAIVLRVKDLVGCFDTELVLVLVGRSVEAFQSTATVGFVFIVFQFFLVTPKHVPSEILETLVLDFSEFVGLVEAIF